ncbi:MAG: alpha-1,2-fucosyltransferase [Candidatus Pacebacteria bacterium]|nr:alpha-1,2-fucosyltransferase [Candidatus Paceibacterota bacterium]
MIILKVKAGLGNQMFQYAYAKARAIRSGVELKIDLSWFDNQPKRDTFRYYGLNHFNISSDTFKDMRTISPFKKLLTRIYKKALRIISDESDYVYYPRLAKPVSKSKDVTVEGYWNTEKYFAEIRDTLKKEFTLKEALRTEAKGAEKEIYESAQSGEIPVLILVRRGDYVSNIHTKSFHGAMQTDYFSESISRMIKELGEDANKIHFFITTDDTPWVKENITSDILMNKPFTFISRPGVLDYEELYLMSLCHHFILSNSTFCWWAAWLSEAVEKSGSKKVVIGPKQWVANPKVDTRDVMPEEWIRI